MRPASLVSRASLGVLGLLILAIGLASGQALAHRIRLRCSVTPRMLPASGGEIAIRVSSGGETLDEAVATIIRPDRTPTTVVLVPVAPGEYEGLYAVPENPGRGVQQYSVKVAARAETTDGYSLSCGAVRVRPSTEAPPLAITSCGAFPRRLPPAGGNLRVEAKVAGPRRGLEVHALISGAGAILEPELTFRRGVYRATVALPANAENTPSVFLVRIIATPAEGEAALADCGSVIVASPEATGGIAVLGMERNQPLVRTFRADTLDSLGDFFAFGPNFEGGATLAAGDLTGDGVADFALGAGPGAPPLVQRVRGEDHEDLGSFLAYGAGFTGGVFVAAGDVNGDGRADIITGSGPGAGPHVKVFDGLTGAEYASFFAYPAGFTGGVRVAAGDVNGDGRADIITGAGPGGGPHVKVFNGANLSELRSFFAYDPGFAGGVFVAAGDVNGDGRAEILTGTGTGAGPHVKVFDGRTGAAARSFFAYDTSFRGGVTVSAADLDGDGRVEIITGAGSGAPGGHVKVFNGTTGAELRSFLAFDVGFSGGVFVAGWR